MTHTKHHRILLASFILCLGTMETLWAKEYQSLDAIQETIVHFIQANIDTHQDHDISVNRLDSRLKLGKCSVPLEAYSHANHLEAGTLSIGVRCHGKPSWSLFNSAKLTFYQQVLTLKQSLKRNTIIRAEHIIIEKQATNQLRRGYFTDYQQVANKLTTRHLHVGTVLNPTHLTTQKLIKKGEQVTILASSPAFSIKMPGRALMDGSLGEQIRIKNSKTKKIIEGIYRIKNNP